MYIRCFCIILYMMLEDKSQHAAQFLSTLIRMHASMKDKMCALCNFVKLFWIWMFYILVLGRIFVTIILHSDFKVWAGFTKQDKGGLGFWLEKGDDDVKMPFFDIKKRFSDVCPSATTDTSLVLFVDSLCYIVLPENKDCVFLVEFLNVLITLIESMLYNTCSINDELSTYKL